MHLADDHRQERRPGLQAEPAQGLVFETAGRHDQRRLRGHLRTERAAAEPAGAAGERLLAGLSLPRAAGDHAHQAGRHRPVQIRRIQTRQVDPPGAQSRLLEEGPALSRRDHVSDDRQPRDADAGFLDRRLRHHLSGRRQRSPDEGRQGTRAQRDLRDDHHGNPIQPDGEPRKSAVRQSGAAQGDVAGDRSQGFQYHPDGRPGVDAAEPCCRSPPANGACRRKWWPR